MAVCEIWDVKGRLDHPIDYAKNPEKTVNPKYTEADLQALGDVMKYATNGEKTEKQFFVTGVNCDPATARDEMMITKGQWQDESEIVCYHGYQSFKKGEVTPEQAHEVGVKLAERMWGDRFQVIVATHLNTDCLHNHFVLNSVSFADGKHYHDNKKNLRLLRKRSDELSREYALSVIEQPSGRKKPYALYQAEKQGLPTRDNTPVSAEVEAYDPLIRQYASQHGIPEYVELIKAVMMQESGGRGNDPMQASECGYNTRYPNTPNGITDPEYSIDVGIQNLADCLNAAEVENPVDMEHIKLALQGYNFGNGYISWAKNNYGGYSYANAVEFSAIQAERLGWDSYGDTQYVAHVLRYYPYGRAFTSGGNQAIVEVALTQLGNVGGEPYWSWYGFDSRVEWCACFVSWCAEQCGYLESGIIPKYSLCSDGVNWFRNNGQWQGRDYEPTAGNLIFFDWEGDGTIDHTGIVEKSENGTVYTVEGNSGDECKQRNYPVGSSVIYGYGIPAY